MAVRSEKPGSAWVDGVVIGAEGEILFGLDPGRGPTGRLEVRLDDGRRQAATLLGFDRGLGVAVARMAPGAPRRAPPAVDLAATLRRDRWLVVLTHDKRGVPTSHAGQVEGRAKGGRVAVFVPGRVGSPLLSTDGALVGLVVRAGRRKTAARPLSALLPFLRRVVQPAGATP